MVLITHKICHGNIKQNFFKNQDYLIIKLMHIVIIIDIYW